MLSFRLVYLRVLRGLGKRKSTLVDQTLKRILGQHFNGSKDLPGAHKEVRGLELADKMIVIDQSPIGRTPRSNPALIRVRLQRFEPSLPPTGF